MREIIISANEANQRLDKFLGKYMNQAPSGFFYKMMRKKNIVLNGKKADCKEKSNQTGCDAGTANRKAQIAGIQWRVG